MANGQCRDPIGCSRDGYCACEDTFVELPGNDKASQDRAYWYRQGKDDGIEQERGNTIEWLMREEEGYPSGEYSGFAAMIREAIEAGEHLK